MPIITFFSSEIHPSGVFCNVCVALLKVINHIDFIDNLFLFSAGRQFDKDGNLKQWWDDEVIERFKEMAQCIVNQYGNYTIEEVGENVSYMFANNSGSKKNAGPPPRSTRLRKSSEKLENIRAHVCFLNYMYILYELAQGNIGLMSLQTLCGQMT